MKHGKSPYTSAVYVWNGTSTVFFSSCLTPFHSHNTMQLVLDTQTSFRFRVKNGSWGIYKSLIVKENVIHQLDTNKSVQLIVYLAADSPICIRVKYPCVHWRLKCTCLKAASGHYLRASRACPCIVISFGIKSGLPLIRSWLETLLIKRL